MEFGRQRPDEPAPTSFDANHQRLVIAELHDKLVSRQHLRLESVGPSPTAPKIRVANLSKKRSIWINNSQRLAPGEHCEESLPALVTFEDFAIRIEASLSHDNSWEMQSLDHPTLAPGGGALPRAAQLSQHVSQLVEHSVASQITAPIDQQQLVQWLAATMDVLQSASGQSDYLRQAVEAVQHIVGLDEVLALTFDGQEWKVQTSVNKRSQQSAKDNPSRQLPSSTALDRLLQIRRTIRRVPKHNSASNSLQGITALVVAPILNVEGVVIGALYGIRNQNSLSSPQISELEATMVEVLACGAAAGIAREEQQRRALEARVLFEQFFTPALAKELESNPRLLDSQNADISVLFCDIVGFSAISGRISSTLTMQWIQGVMDELSDIVAKHEGVLVDYIGDELLAMWGAPKPTIEHSRLASLAAQDMLACRAKINARWQDQIGARTEIRIGIASGDATVGNTGSSKKFKYGPLGDTVNLASRLQGAGKYLGIETLVNAEVALSAQDCDQLLFRPLGRAKLAGMVRAVPIFQPLAPTPKNFALTEIWRTISQAAEACDPRLPEIVDDLILDCPQDRPLQMLQHQLAASPKDSPLKDSSGGRASGVLWELEHK